MKVAAHYRGALGLTPITRLDPISAPGVDAYLIWFADGSGQCMAADRVILTEGA